MSPLPAGREIGAARPPRWAAAGRAAAALPPLWQSEAAAAAPQDAPLWPAGCRRTGAAPSGCCIPPEGAGVTRAAQMSASRLVLGAPAPPPARTDRGAVLGQAAPPLRRSGSAATASSSTAGRLEPPVGAATASSLSAVRLASPVGVVPRHAQQVPPGPSLLQSVVSVLSVGASTPRAAVEAALSSGQRPVKASSLASVAHVSPADLASAKTHEAATTSAARWTVTTRAPAHAAAAAAASAARTPYSRVRSATRQTRGGTPRALVRAALRRRTRAQDPPMDGPSGGEALEADDPDPGGLLAVPASDRPPGGPVPPSAPHVRSRRSLSGWRQVGRRWGRPLQRRCCTLLQGPLQLCRRTGSAAHAKPFLVLIPLPGSSVCQRRPRLVRGPWRRPLSWPRVQLPMSVLHQGRRGCEDPSRVVERAQRRARGSRARAAAHALVQLSHREAQAGHRRCPAVISRGLGWHEPGCE